MFLVVWGKESSNTLHVDHKADAPSHHSIETWNWIVPSQPAKNWMECRQNPCWIRHRHCCCCWCWKVVGSSRNFAAEQIEAARWRNSVVSYHWLWLLRGSEELPLVFFSLFQQIELIHHWKVIDQTAELHEWLDTQTWQQAWQTTEDPHTPLQILSDKQSVCECMRVEMASADTHSTCLANIMQVLNTDPGIFSVT